MSVIGPDVSTGGNHSRHMRVHKKLSFSEFYLNINYNKQNKKCEKLFQILLYLNFSIILRKSYFEFELH